MSRLDSFIRRMTAQRLLLDEAALLVAAIPGPVLDLGLGAGRTFDHLCMLFPDRRVFAFDVSPNVAFGAQPEPERMVLGDIRETLALALPRIGARAALIHNDLGSADAVGNAIVASWLAPAILAVARHDAIVVTSFPLAFSGAVALSLPAGVAADRYHILRLGV